MYHAMIYFEVNGFEVWLKTLSYKPQDESLAVFLFVGQCNSGFRIIYE